MSTPNQVEQDSRELHGFIKERMDMVYNDGRMFERGRYNGHLYALIERHEQMGTKKVETVFRELDALIRKLSKNQLHTNS